MFRYPFRLPFNHPFREAFSLPGFGEPVVTPPVIDALLVWLKGNDDGTDLKLDSRLAPDAENFKITGSACASLNGTDEYGTTYINHGSIAFSEGTSTVTYVGNTLSFSTPGTFYNVTFTDGTHYRVAEGPGDGTNLTSYDDTGTSTITWTADPATLWAQRQDNYHGNALDDWWEITGDSVYYPYDPSLKAITHIVLYGQSLSLGTVPTGASVVTSSPSVKHKMFNGAVRVHYDTLGIANVNSYIAPTQIESITSLQEQMNPNDADYGETYASGMGLGITEQCLFSCTGRGAYKVDQLDRTGDTLGIHFQNTYASVLHGAAVAEAEGYPSYKLGLLLFKQGEADGSAGTTKIAWKASVSQLHDDLVSHLVNASLVDMSDFGVVVDQQAMGQAGLTYGEIAVAAIELHRTAGNGITCAGPMYPEEFVAINDVHMTSNGYRNYGERLGLMYEKMLTGIPWEPCHITSVSRISTTITVGIHVPVPPLVEDATTVATVDDLGFTYTGANIIDVSITDTTGVIEITLDAAAAGTLGFAYENNSINQRIGPDYGPRGNLRDSESAVTVNDGMNLYNWLCVDSWEVV